MQGTDDMTPTAVRGRHLPGLDGLRGLAVAGVVAYHLRVGWASGGFLGVDLFFVLSGFLITGLLLEERSDAGRIGLGRFWARRARRLLPALLLLLAVLAGAGAAGWLAGVDLRSLRGDALATLVYVANWHQLAAGHSYFAQFQAPSPLQHTWSLAIEEQYYLVWPPLLAGILWLSARRAAGPTRPTSEATTPASAPAPWRGPLLAGTVAGGLASATWMGWLAAHGATLDRLYYGTDTRAFDLLAGCALATWAAWRPDPGALARRRLHGSAVVAAGVLGVLWATGGGRATGAAPPRLMFEGGFALAAVAATVVVADGRLEEPGLLGRLLRLAPLRYLGRISYGVYLWHWPVITQLTGARIGISGAPLDLLQVATIAVVSVASFHLVEQPVRRASLAGWPRAARAGLAPLAMAATALVVAVSVPPPVAQAAVGSPNPAGTTPVSGSGGLGGQLPVTLADGRVPTAKSPLRVLLVGDSVMQTEAPALQAALGATGVAVVTDASFPGWGLFTDHSWATDLPGLLARDRPDLVVATWSWDDDWVLSDPTGYRVTLERFVHLCLHPGGGVRGVSAVLFEEFPPLLALPFAPDGWAAQLRRVEGAKAWSAVAARMPAAFPGRVQYLPLAPAVELSGKFSLWLPPPGASRTPVTGWVRVRMVDNTHFCPAGAARYADALLVDLQSVLHLPVAASSWWNGRWADSPVYRAGTGACPADHPA